MPHVASQKVADFKLLIIELITINAQSNFALKSEIYRIIWRKIVRNWLKKLKIVVVIFKFNPLRDNPLPFTGRPCCSSPRAGAERSPELTFRRAPG